MKTVRRFAPLFHAGSLTWRFAVASLVLTSLLTAALGYGLMVYLAAQIDEHALDDVQADASDIVARRLLNHLSAEDFAEPLSGERLAEFDAFVEESVISARTSRVVIWNTSGQVVYSDDPEQLGEVFSMSDDRAEAFAGEVVAEVSEGESDGDVQVLSKGKMVEVYVPVVFEGSNGVVGLFEVYQSYAPFADQALTMRRFVTIALVGGLGTLWLALMGVVNLAARTIHRQNRALRQALRERAKTEQARARLAAIVQRTTDVVATIDARGEVLYMNNAGRDLLGLSGDARVVGMQLVDLFPAEERQTIAGAR